MTRGRRILDRYVELLPPMTGLSTLHNFFFLKHTKLRYRCDTDSTAEWPCLRWSWLHDSIFVLKRRQCF